MTFTVGQRVRIRNEGEIKAHLRGLTGVVEDVMNASIGVRTVDRFVWAWPEHLELLDAEVEK